MLHLHRPQTMNDDDSNAAPVDWTEFDVFRENKDGFVESVHSDDSGATEEYTPNSPSAEREGTFVDESETDDSEALLEDTDAVDTQTITQYIVNLGSTVDRIDQNDLSEIQVSIAEFDGKVVPNLEIHTRDDQLFRRVFSNLVQGRFPSSFREFAGPISRMEEAHIISKFRHLNYEVGLETWSTYHIIQTMFKLAMHSGDVTIRKLCSTICPDFFHIEGARQQDYSRALKRALGDREISRIATYGFAPRGTKRELMRLADLLGTGFKQGFTTFLVGFVGHARTLFKNDTFGWLLLNSHGSEEDNDFYKDTFLGAYKGRYGKMRRVNVPYSTRFASSIAQGLYKLTDEEAARAGVESEHSAVKLLIKKATTDKDWLNTWMVAFECMRTSMLGAFANSPLLSKVYDEIHERMSSTVTRAMKLVESWFDEEYVPTDSDAETDEQRVYTLAEDEAHGHTARLLHRRMIPKFTLTDFWAVIHDTVQIFVSIIENFDVYDILAEGGPTPRKKRGVPSLSINDILGDPERELAAVGDVQTPASLGPPESALMQWSVGDEDSNRTGTTQVTSTLFEIDGSTQRQDKHTSGEDGSKRTVKRKRVQHTQAYPDDLNVQQLADAIRREHARLLSNIRAMRGAKTVFEYGYASSGEANELTRSFWPLAVETVTWWADRFNAVKLVRVQTIPKLQGENNQCQLYSVLMAIYYECIKNNQTTTIYRKLFDYSLTLKDAFSYRPSPVVFALVDRLYNLASRMHKDPGLIEEWVKFHKTRPCKLCGSEVLNGEHTDVRDFFRCLFKRNHIVKWSENHLHPERIISILNDVLSVVAFHEPKYTLLDTDRLDKSGVLDMKKTAFGWKGTVRRYVLSEYDILKLYTWDISFRTTNNMWVYCSVVALFLIHKGPRSTGWHTHEGYTDDTFFENLHRIIGSQYKKDDGDLYPGYISVETKIAKEFCDAVRRTQGECTADFESEIYELIGCMREKLYLPENRYDLLMYLLLAVSCPFPNMEKVGSHAIPDAYADYGLLLRFVHCLNAESGAATELIKAEQMDSIETGSVPLNPDYYDDTEAVTKTLHFFGIQDSTK